ncbi:MAG: Zn-dependent hydrolase [Actinomycetota bacterium]|nr:Zn-dependent hydrolase [Actinomycetota bacterium]
MSWHELRVDGARLWARLEALGEVGEVLGPNGERGNARLALTDADRDGRDLVVGWMRDLGLDVVIDAVGNVVGTRAGTDPTAAPVMVGSHIDTVRTGGRFDGNLGVLGGLEVVETLAQHGVATTHPVSVAFFTGEEGARFQPDMLGSLVYVGGMALEDALDVHAADDGARLGDELARIGFAGPTPCPVASAPHAYFELHIEQGPVLEDEGVTIGVVTGVQGISWTELSITGQSAHAGTTPMRLRRDPGYVAAAINTGVRALATEMAGSQVATVGRCEFTPNLVNVVPAKVTLTVDLRNTDEALLQQAESVFTAYTDALAQEEGVLVERRTLARFEPVEFHPGMVDLVEATARRLGHSTRRMPSGAGHDAQMLARVCPTAMVFVPSVNGLSHNIAEHTEPADVTAGANVLLHVVLATAGVRA